MSFWSHHPELSAGVANTLIDEFMAHHVDQKVEATRSATAFLSKQKDDARRKLETAEALLSDFLTQNDIQFVGVDRSREPQALINQQLVTLSEALLKARAERIAKESALNNALSAETGAISPVLQNPLISHLKEETAALARKYRELGQAFKPDYPRLQRLAQNMSEVRAQVQEETRRVIDAISSDYQVALQNEIELQKLVDEQRSLARKLDGQMVRLQSAAPGSRNKARTVHGTFLSPERNTDRRLAPHIEHLNRGPRGGAADAGGAAHGAETVAWWHGWTGRGSRARLLLGAPGHEDPRRARSRGDLTCADARLGAGALRRRDPPAAGTPAEPG